MKNKYLKIFLFVFIFTTFLFNNACQTVTTSHETNLKISAMIQNKLSQIPDFPIETVHIETLNDTVFLSGYVKTIKQSDAAYMVAMRTPGVKYIENNIIVRR